MQRVFILAAAIASATIAPGFAQQTRTIDLETNSIAYDSTSHRIFASIPQGFSAPGDTIAIIDPDTLQVGPFIPVGSDPGQIAIADDGSCLYVVLDGLPGIARVDLQTLQTDLVFNVGTDASGTPLTATDLDIQPTNPDVIAVVAAVNSLSFEHVAIFDNGVQRPRVTQTENPKRIEFSDNPNVLLGYNNRNSGFEILRMDVQPQGVRVTSDVASNIQGFSTDLEYHDGLCYGTDGAIADPNSGASLGRFRPLIGPTFTKQIAVDAKLDRACFVHGVVSFGPAIDIFRISDTKLLDQIPVSLAGSASLIRWGRDGLAYRRSSTQSSPVGQIVLIDEIPAMRSLRILPPSGDLLTTEAFDIIAVVSAPGAQIEGISRATLNGRDISPSLIGTWIAGSLTTGERTLRWPANTLPKLEAGTQRLEIELSLGGDSRVSQLVVWQVTPTVETPTATSSKR